MYQHRHITLPGTDERLLRRHSKPPLLHLREKSGRGKAPRIGYQGTGVRLQKLRDQASEQRAVAALVEYVCGVDDVKGALKLPEPRLAPIQKARLRLPSQIDPGVVQRKVQGGLVVVRRQRVGTAFERGDRRQTDPAPQLDHPLARERLPREAPGEGRSARPELGPVGKTLVTSKLFFIEERISRDGMGDGVGLLANLYVRLGYTGTPTKMSL